MDNYKLIYKKLQMYYPEIAEELTPEPKPMTDKMVIKAHDLFCQKKGIKEHVNLETRKLFIVVALLIFNPEYIDSVRLKMRTGLRRVLSSIVSPKGVGGFISIHAKNGISDYFIYKAFREEADTLAEIIEKEL
jgi:hypothetical protein